MRQILNASTARPAMIGKVGHFNLFEEAVGGGLWRAYRARDTVHGRTVLIKVAPAGLAEPGQRRDRFLWPQRGRPRRSHTPISRRYSISGTAAARCISPSSSCGVRRSASSWPPDHNMCAPRSRWKPPPISRRSRPAVALSTSAPTSSRSGRSCTKVLTGVTAFRAGSVEVTLASVLDTRPREPSELDPKAPEALDAVVRRALAKPVDERFQSAASFAAELRSVAAIVDIRSAAASRRSSLSGSALDGGGPVSARWVGWGSSRSASDSWSGASRRSPSPAGRSMARAAAGGDRGGVAARARGRGVAILRRWTERGSCGSDRAVAGRFRGRSRRRVGLRQDDVRDADGARRIGRRRARGRSRAERRARTQETPPVSEGAYDLYLRGRDAAAQRDTGRAIALYESAISGGEGFAELYAALAYALHAETGPGGAQSEADRIRLDEVATLAAATDPDLL